MLYFVAVPAFEAEVLGTWAQATNGLVKIVSAPPVRYDEHAVLVEVSGVEGWSVNVTLSASMDPDGFGPSFLVNGLTSLGYEYQAGIGFNTPAHGGYVPGFSFLYEVWAPNGSFLEVGLYPVRANSGDVVQLELNFSGSMVQMGMNDSTSRANASYSYSSENCSRFVYLEDTLKGTGFFTGLMTEWWHAHPYYGPFGAATFTMRLSSPAIMGADERDNSTGIELFDNATPPRPLSSVFQDFSLDNVTEQVNGTEFVTG